MVTYNWNKTVFYIHLIVSTEIKVYIYWEDKICYFKIKLQTPNKHWDLNTGKIIRVREIWTQIIFSLTKQMSDLGSNSTFWSIQGGWVIGRQSQIDLFHLYSAQLHSQLIDKRLLPIVKLLLAPC